METQIMNQGQNFYSFKQTQFWCHLCRKSFKKLLNSQTMQDTFCETCGAPCEEIEKNNRPQDFYVYDPSNRNGQQRPNYQQNQQQNQNQQRQQQQQQQQQQQREGNYVFHFVMNPFFFFGGFDEELDQQRQPTFFDQLIQEFINNDPNNHGPAPASKDKINQLQEVQITENNKKEMCAVCQEEYQKGDTCTKMPCGHNFHKNCVNEWLTRHNSCPICRKAI